MFNMSVCLERNSNLAKQKYPHVKVARSIGEVLQDQSIDLVVITTPNTSHYSLAEQCLLAGKHVVVEKPFTCTSEEAYKLCKLAKDCKLILSVFHNRRYDGDFLTIKHIVAQGMLGDLVEFESHFDRYRTQPKFGAWREQNEIGSGVLFDLGSHLIDQAVQLFGEPDVVRGDVKHMRKQPAVDYFDVQLCYDAKPELKVTLKASCLVKQLGPRVRIVSVELSL